jgi:DNA-binding MarR family transcriptional regulator
MVEGYLDEIFDSLYSVYPVFRRKLKKIGDAILEDMEISMAHVKLMDSLRKEGACSMTDLGNMLSVSKPNITTLVDKLVELNLTKRSFDKNDRRVSLIELTDHGNDFLQKLTESAKVTLRSRLQKFSEDDLALFRETLNNMELLIHKMNDGNA